MANVRWSVVLLQLLVTWWICFVICRAAFNLTLLHCNDVHARYDETNEYGSRCPEGSKACFGGVARMMTKVKEIRNNLKNVLFLNAGDYYQGTLYYSIHKWNISVFFMNMLQYDAMAVGNHEFDDGIQGLVPFLMNAKFPVLACNIDSSNEPSIKDWIIPSIIKDADGEKIGIIGYTTKTTPSIAYVGKLIFNDEIPCIMKEVKAMKRDGVNKIIALGHSGFNIDKEIAEKVEGVDIVIGGHTNTFTYTGPPPSIDIPVAPYPLVITQEDGSKVLVLEAFAFGKYLGFLNVEFDNDGRVTSWNGNPILLDNLIPKDEKTERALKPYKKVVIEQGHVVVGQTMVDLVGDRRICRMQECNMGNMLTDAMVWYNKGKAFNGHWTTLTMAVWNAGGIRSSLIRPINEITNITVEDILTIAPFGNTIDIVDMKGKGLLSVMEQSVSDYDPKGVSPSGGFLQISGMKVEYDLSKNVGQRIVKLFVLCNNCSVPSYELVKEDDIYSVAVPTFLLEGGDGFDVISKIALQVDNRGTLDADIIVKYLEKMSPVSPAVEGRIVFSDGSNNALSSLTRCNFPVFAISCLLYVILQNHLGLLNI